MCVTAGAKTVPAGAGGAHGHPQHALTVTTRKLTVSVHVLTAIPRM